MALTPEEWLDLRVQLIRTTEALKQLFQPDHMNYVFLQNRHVHMHLYTRYGRPRVFAGVTFDDSDSPSHNIERFAHQDCDGS